MKNISEDAVYKRTQKTSIDFSLMVPLHSNLEPIKRPNNRRQKAHRTETKVTTTNITELRGSTLILQLAMKLPELTHSKITWLL